MRRKHALIRNTSSYMASYLGVPTEHFQERLLSVCALTQLVRLDRPAILDKMLFSLHGR